MSSLAQEQNRYLRHDAYFALEKQEDQKYEYIAGEVFAMSGGSVRHGLISTNATTALSIALRDHNCSVLNSDVKLHIDTVDSFFYPDAMVLCEDADIQEHYVRHPYLIVEVLSPSTEDYDHNRKFAYYRQIPALKIYMMLHQTEAFAEVYQRCPDKSWLFNEYKGLDSIMTLGTIQLAMHELYRHITFNDPAPHK